MRKHFSGFLTVLSLVVLAGCGSESGPGSAPEKEAREAFAKFKKAWEVDKNMNEAQTYLAKDILDRYKNDTMMLKMQLNSFARVEIDKTTAKVTGNTIAFELVQKSEAKSSDGSPMSGSMTMTQTMLTMVKEGGTWKLSSR